MGSWLSRDKRSTLEILEELEIKIGRLESDRQATEVQQRDFTFNLTVLLTFIPVIGISCWLWFYRPQSRSGWFKLSSAAISTGILVAFGRYSARLVFTRLIDRKEAHLIALRGQRTELLDSVKHKEPYNVAREILEKFDPEVRMEKAAKEQQQFEQKQLMVKKNSPPNSTTLRQRNVGSSSSSVFSSSPIMTGTLRPQMSQFAPQSNEHRPCQLNSLQIPMARPILPQFRSPMDKVVDYLLGDGPNNRYALICSQCHSHNGMSLLEEFEYLAFRCCFCYAFNPARRQRPGIPALTNPDRSQSVNDLTINEQSNFPSPLVEELSNEVTDRDFVDDPRPEPELETNHQSDEMEE